MNKATDFCGYFSDGTGLSYDVHAFYYGWYASPGTDGVWGHWDHPYLPNWDKSDKRDYPTGKHRPEENDLGSDFYPALGPYSSSDPAVIEDHMEQVRTAGVGVIVFSWYPPDSTGTRLHIEKSGTAQAIEYYQGRPER